VDDVTVDGGSSAAGVDGPLLVPAAGAGPNLRL
jgi:hypothetical protein